MEGLDENGLPLERFSPQHPLLVELQPPGGVDVRQWVATDAAGAAGSRPPPGHGFGRPSTKKPPIKKQLTTAHQLKWLVIDRQGNTSMMTSYKNEITQQTGIQLRDLRRAARPPTRPPADAARRPHPSCGALSLILPTPPDAPFPVQAAGSQAGDQLPVCHPVPRVRTGRQPRVRQDGGHRG
jgi:hypothetical protein